MEILILEFKIKCYFLIQSTCIILLLKEQNVLGKCSFKSSSLYINPSPDIKNLARTTRTLTLASKVKGNG